LALVLVTATEDELAAGDTSVGLGPNCGSLLRLAAVTCEALLRFEAVTPSNFGVFFDVSCG
jgi:hypothetical protein